MTKWLALEHAPYPPSTAAAWFGKEEELLVVGLVLDHVLSNGRVKSAVGRGLDGNQLIPGIVAVTMPLASVGSITSIFREPSRRRGESLGDFLHAAVTAGERTAPQQVFGLIAIRRVGGAFGVSELTPPAAPQLELWLNEFSVPKTFAKRSLS